MLQWALDNVEIHLTHIIRDQLHYAKAAEDIKLIVWSQSVIYVGSDWHY